RVGRRFEVTTLVKNCHPERSRRFACESARSRRTCFLIKASSSSSVLHPERSEGPAFRGDRIRNLPGGQRIQINNLMIETLRLNRAVQRVQQIGAVTRHIVEACYSEYREK